MLRNFHDNKLFLIILALAFLLNSDICAAKHHPLLRDTSSFYDKLMETLKPVLERGNLSAKSALGHETDYDYTNNDSPDVEEPPAHIFDNNRNISAKKTNSRHHRSNRNNAPKNFKTSGLGESRPHKSKLSVAEHHVNRSSEHEVDYDYRNQDNPDVEEPPAPIFEHRHRVNNTGHRRIKDLKAKLRHKTEQSQKLESLYEKYKAKLQPYVHHVNATPASAAPNKRKDAYEFFFKEKAHLAALRMKNLSQQSAYTSLYDEFKKRLVDFSADLDIDAGLTGESKSSYGYADAIHHEGDERVTAEFQKVQSIADHIGKDTALIQQHPKKRYESASSKKRKTKPLHSKSKKSIFFQPAKLVDEDYLKNHNYHRIYSGRQPATSGGYINSDYNYEDSFRPLPIFRKPEVPLKSKKRPLRGAENMDKYLGLSGAPGTDGAFYNTFFPSIYTDSINRQLGNLTATSLLENIANKLNMSTIDVAKKVAGIKGLNLSTLKKDPKLHELLQQYIESSVVSAAKAADSSTPNLQFHKDAKNDKAPQLNFPDLPYEMPKINSDIYSGHHSNPKMQQTVNSQTTYQNPDFTKQTQLEELLKAFSFDKGCKAESATPQPVETNQNCEEPPEKEATTSKPANNENNCIEEVKTIKPENNCIEVTTPRIENPANNCNTEIVTTGMPLNIANNCVEEVTTPRTDDKCETTTQQSDNTCDAVPLDEGKSALTPDQVSEILDKLTRRLEEIQHEKGHESYRPIEDAPCKLNGSWQSKAMGLRFDMTLQDYADEKALPRQARSHGLNVTVREMTPPKPHDIMDTDWPVRGRALNENGGPFYLYAQKRSENLLGTFVGYCRNCGGVDTVYGTWCFSFPSKSCQDLPASFQTKNDIMRRYKLEDKRRTRFEALTGNRTKNAIGGCYIIKL